MADNNLTHKTKLIFDRHKKQDSLDVSFRIRGHELKWLAPQAQENGGDGPWQILRKSDIPQEMLRQLESQMIGLFKNGDTIRHDELVLAYAPKEHVDEVRSENTDAAKSAMDAIYSRHKSQGTKSLSIDLKETGYEKLAPEDFKI